MAPFIDLPASPLGCASLGGSLGSTSCGSSASAGSLLFSPSREALEEKRRCFEGKNETHEEAKERLRQILGPRKRMTEKERFLQLMRQQGGGNLTISWRRYFDQDGDGELSFREFCTALAGLGYSGDTIALWHAVGGCETNLLSLGALDPDGAEVLEYFGRWCARTLGGPYEVFAAMDDDDSDSLTMEEFTEGLVRLGFFASPAIPHSVATEELAQQNLYPCLDSGGKGAISADELMFLEKDVQKRDRIKRELARIRKYGRRDAADPLPKDAESVLRQGKVLIRELWANDELEQGRRPRALSRPSSASASSLGGCPPPSGRSGRGGGGLRRRRRPAATAPGEIAGPGAGGGGAAAGAGPGPQSVLASSSSLSSLVRRVRTWPNDGGQAAPAVERRAAQASAGLLEPKAQRPLEPHRLSALARKTSGPATAWEDEIALADAVARIPTSR